MKEKRKNLHALCGEKYIKQYLCVLCAFLVKKMQHRQGAKNAKKKSQRTLRLRGEKNAALQSRQERKELQEFY